MKTINTIAGNVYCVTSKNGGTLTDSTGTLNETIEAGKQLHITAPSDMLLIDDDEAIMRPANFKKARLALRMLGAGKKAELPSGYTRIDFLESTGAQYVNTGLAPFDTEMEGIEFGCRLDAVMTETTTWRSAAGIYRNDGISGFTSMMRTGSSKLCFYFGQKGIYIEGDMDRTLSRFVHDLNYKKSRRSVFKSVEGVQETPLASDASMGFVTSYGLTLFGTMNQYGGVTRSRCRIWGAEFTNGRAVVKKLIPCIAPNGIPCMFDLVGLNECANVGTTAFIAGVASVAQLRSILSKLPATGGELTLSLPAEANTPEVAAELQACQDRTGWTLTVREYRPAAVTTYALRRVRQAVWCRMAENTDGSYVSDGGERFEIDRCADIYGPLGSDPAAYGYELFDSVEDAAAWFGLTPYEYPEEENLI